MVLKTRYNRWRDRYLSLWWRWQKSLTQRLQRIPESADYKAWRDRFITHRYWLCLWLATGYFTLEFVIEVYTLFIYLPSISPTLPSPWQHSDLLQRSQHLAIAAYLTRMGLFGLNGIVGRTPWGKQHRVLLWFCLSESVHFIPTHLLGTLFRIPSNLETTFFMVQALLIPVHWRIHFLTQLPSLLHYTLLYPAFDLIQLNNPMRLIPILLLCSICLLGVYLYERLKLSEFEAQRQLKGFIHSIAHDLRTPIMGTTLMLQSLRKQAQLGDARLTLADIDQLLAGNDRLLSLMNSLLDVHLPGNSNLQVNLQPIHLSIFVNGVLNELQPNLIKHRIQLVNYISPELPPINVDPHLLWRVFYNLLSNIWIHNRPGVKVILTAEVMDETMLCCRIQDNGVGISQPEQMFELYARAKEANYRPGLGLGLYISRQIIVAHGGQIGAQNDAGATIWFTIPIAQDVR
jgi:signal transduction histidine kinase